YWLERYPGSVASHMYDKYQPVELPAKPNDESLKSRGKPDSRLPAEKLVLGVADGKEARAYPLETVEKMGLIQDNLDGKPCVVLSYGPTKTAAAYRPAAVPPRKDARAPRAASLA